MNILLIDDEHLEVEQFGIFDITSFPQLDDF